MNKKTTKLFFIAICFLAFTSAQNLMAQQTVAWSVVQLVDGTEVLTEGALKEALNFSGGDTPANHNTTINTVPFSGLASGAASGNVFANPTATHFSSNSQNVVPFNVDQYDAPPGIAGYDELLSRFLWSGGAATITLSGLEATKSYKVQLFMGDKRDGQADSFITLTVGGVAFGDASTTKYAGTTTAGIVINGEFVAQGTSFDIELNKDLLGAPGFNLNGYQLREVASLSVNESSLGDFGMYPNPTKSEFTINLKNREAIGSKVTITSLLGQVVYKGKFEEVSKSINVSNLNTGIYLVSVSGNNTFATKKLVIK